MLNQKCMEQHQNGWLLPLLEMNKFLLDEIAMAMQGGSHVDSSSRRVNYNLRLLFVCLTQNVGQLDLFLSFFIFFLYIYLFPFLSYMLAEL